MYTPYILIIPRASLLITASVLHKLTYCLLDDYLIHFSAKDYYGLLNEKNTDRYRKSLTNRCVTMTRVEAIFGAEKRT